MDPSPTLLDSYLKELRLPTMLRHYRQVAEDAAQANLPYDRFLLALVEQEVAQREHNRQQPRVKAARFPVLKELADFDFSCLTRPTSAPVLRLAQGDYIRQAEPIRLVGNPGLGKTHLATALALTAARQGFKVRFYTAAGLVNDLITAQNDQRLPRFLTASLKQHVIVLDELGFIPFSTTGAHLMFQFCSTLYERIALIVTTNLRFADWTQVFGHERLTAALLDRLTHKAHILDFMGGASYRFRQRMQRQAASSSESV
jgi:DNA replication protein DnaC